MGFTVTEIAELIEYHLVASATDDDTADGDLGRLVAKIQHLATRPLWREATWVFCDRCGTSVDTDLIDPHGHHYSKDGEFYCAGCWDEMP